MFIIKSFLILVLLAFFGINHSFATSDENRECSQRLLAQSLLNLDGLQDTYMVHLSRVMSENSTKIAGGMRGEYDSATLGLKKFILSSEGSMIRSRITLHHSFGGAVPECYHGLPVDTLLGRVKLPSDLYSSKDVCAYLDPLSEFKGELIGGYPEDIMSIDRHVYNSKSIVIIPEHRIKEFQVQNPLFLGRIVRFDSCKATIAEKVEEIISNSPNQISLSNLYTIINLEEKQNKFDTFDVIKTIFTSNGLMFCSHEETAFRALEHIIAPFNQQIRSAYEKDNHTIGLAADKVASRLAIIRSLIDIALDSSLDSLNDEKKIAMKNWQQDVLAWLNIFEVDANLRQKFDKTLFIDNLRWGVFIKNRGNKDKLYELAKLLQPFNDRKELNLRSKELFPEFSASGIVSGPGWKDFIQNTDFQILLKLKDNLVTQGYSKEGHGIVLIRLMDKIYEAVKYGSSIPKKDSEILKGNLDKLDPSSQIQTHIYGKVENIIMADKSYKNKITRKYLNSALGTYFQKQIFGKSKNWTYSDLLLQCEYTRIIFADLDDLVHADENSYSKVRDYEKNFIDVVRRWMLDQASNESKKDPTSMIANIGDNLRLRRLKNPYFSITNINSALRMVDILTDYRQFLSFSLLEKDHPFNILIEQGCFSSWPDIMQSILPLEKLTSEEIKHILINQLPQLFGSGNRFYTIDYLYLRINNYKNKKEESLSNYQEEAEKYKVKLENLYQFSPNKTTSGSQLSELFDNFIYGEERIIQCGLDEYKIIISPNWGMAWDLYHKASFNAGSTKWRICQLQRFMAPIFEKALTVRHT